MTSYLLACYFLVICALACIILTPRSFAVERQPAKNVLILYSFTDRRALDDLELLKTEVRSHVAGPVDFQVEYLESNRFGAGGYEKSLSESLAHAYQGTKFDLVLASFYPALQFALQFRDQIFPGVPIVFLSVVRDRIEGHKLPPGVTGVTVNADVRGTINLALRLTPERKNVAVLVGGSQFEHYWQAAIDRELNLHYAKLHVTDLAGLPHDQLLQRVSTLAPDTIVIFFVIPQESAQPVIGTYDLLGAIAQQFPTYCIHLYCLNHGAVGVSYPDPAEQAIKAGKVAGRVLSGENADDIQVITGSPARATVDWGQLRRWNISESSLPTGAVVLNRQPTAWERYEKSIVLGFMLIVVQALWIVALLWQRSRKEKTEAALRESEQRFHLMADTAPALIWMCDEDGKVFYRNETRLDFTGSKADKTASDAWRQYIHPADLPHVLDANAQALKQRQAFSKEYRLLRRDGVYRWMLDVASPRFNGDGVFTGFIGSASDISDQKAAQEALHKMGGKLIEAQERERSRIARELHDDICQRLALLSLELEQTTVGSNGSAAAANARMMEIRQHCAEIANDVQALSHQLHSSKLDYLGLVSALGGLCREFSQQQHVSVEFHHLDIPNTLPKDISLCLFRVVQEALHNALKYSGVNRFLVELRSDASGIQLEVSDSGAGFDVAKAQRNGGLGLVSMQERVLLIHGALRVESKVNRGTRIVAQVPIPKEQMEGTAAAAATAARN